MIVQFPKHPRYLRKSQLEVIFVVVVPNSFHMFLHFRAFTREARSSINQSNHLFEFNTLKPYNIYSLFWPIIIKKWELCRICWHFRRNIMWEEEKENRIIVVWGLNPVLMRHCNDDSFETLERLQIISAIKISEL